jgi:alkylhydroperoxidase/carboxymuconolactone decarboxylase family protein YurZ
MQARIRRKLSMAQKVLDFSRANPSDDAGYTGVVTRLEQSITRASSLAQEAVDTTEEELMAIRRRVRTRRRIQQQLRHLASVAAAAAVQQPGLDEAFALPRKNLPNRQFSAKAKIQLDRATEHLELLKTFALGESFIADLTAAIAEFDSAGKEANVDRVTHVGARADLIDASVEAMELVNVLDGFNRARFAADGKLLAAWEAARNLFGPFTRAGTTSTSPSSSPPAPSADEKAA